jgi:nucleoside-diphosphate-sugar epimerase
MARHRVVVTGGSGKLGRAVLRDLVAHGYDVINVDLAPPREEVCTCIRADLADYGQVVDAISSYPSIGAGESAELVVPHAVVHLAAGPAPRLKPNAETFRNNAVSDYNVFEACRRLGVKKVVYASSETVLGLPFDVPPAYVPVDEDAPPRPNSAYSLAKLLMETSAAQMCRWDSTLSMIGLRFSNVMEPHDYARFPGFDADPGSRAWNLWGYIDARDGAQAVRLAIEKGQPGAHVYIIANADTVVTRPDDELLQEFFPDVPRRAISGPNATLLSIDKARRDLGYEPHFNWRQP